MQVTSDGIIFESQTQGGVSRIYQEIFPRMCDMEQSLRIELLTSAKLKQGLPIHQQIKHRLIPPVEYFIKPSGYFFLLRKRVRAFLQQYLHNIAQDSIWNSTYYTIPQTWRGPIVVMVYDMIHERFPTLFHGTNFDLFRQHKKQCIMQADRVVCISEATEQDLKNFYNIDSKRTCVVSLAHSSVFNSQYHHENDKEFGTKKPFLLYVGGRATYKNFAIVLQAYQRWSRRNEVDLVVVGGEWSKAESQLLAQYNMSQQVHLLTNTDDHALCRLYSTALAFVYPSLYEGFGIPLLEAMACNCPLIASHIPSTVEVAADYPIYFEPQEIASLLVAFDTAYDESSTIKQLRYGVTRSDVYSWDKTARQVLDVYNQLV